MADDLAMQIPITAVIDGFENAMNAVKGKMADAMGGVKSSLANVQMAMGAVGIAAGGFLKSAVESAAKGQQNFADLQQTIKSTGGAAGFTADQIKKMSGEIASQTTFTAGEVMKGQNMLLTFTNIQGQVFKDASMAMMDLSQKMGTAPQQTAIQLGKALNDPIKGVTALTRVGVTFTDQQKEQIKAMEESGNMAGAQKVILDELNKEFGGQAAAQLNTYNGQIKLLNNNFNSMKSAIGAAVLPYLQKIVEQINKAVIPIINFVKSHAKMAAAILGVTTVLGTLVGGMAVFGKVSSLLGPAVTGLTSLIGGLSLPIVGVIAAIGALVYAYTQNFGGLKTFVDGVFHKIADAVKTGIDVFNHFHNALDAISVVIGKLFGTDVANKIMEPFYDIRDAVYIVIDIFKGDWQDIGEYLSEGFGMSDSSIDKFIGAFKGIKAMVLDIVSAVKQHIPQIKSIIQSVFEAIVNVWDNILKPAISVMIQIIMTAIQLIIEHWPEIKAVIETVFKAIEGAWNNILKPVLGYIIKIIGDVIKWVADNWPLISKTIEIVLNTVIDIIKTVLKAISDFWEEHGKTIITVASDIWDNIKTVIGTVIHEIEDIVKLVMQVINGDWSGAWNTIKDFFSTLWDALKKIVSNDLNAIWTIIKDIFKPVGDFFKGIWNGVKDTFSSAGDHIKGALDTIKEHGKKALSEMAEDYEKHGGGIKGALATMWDTYTGIYKKGFEVLNNLTGGKLNGIKDTFVKVWDEIVDTIEKVLQPFVDGIKNIFNSLKPGVTKVFNGIKDYLSGVWEAIKLVVMGPILLICDLVTGNFKKLKEDAEKIWNGLKDAFSKILDGIKEIFTGAGQAISSFLSLIWNGIVNTAMNMWNSFTTFLSNLWDNIKTTATNAWNSLKNSIVNLCGDIKQGAINIWNELVNWFDSLPDRLYNAGVSMFTSMKNGVSNTLNSVCITIINGFDSAINFITSLPGKALKWGEDFIDGLVNGIKGAIGKVEDAVSSVADKIRSFLHFSVPDEGSLTDYESWMPDFMAGLANGINKSKGLVTSAIKGLSTDMSVGVKYNAIPAMAGVATGATNRSYSPTPPQIINVVNNMQVDGKTIATSTLKYNDITQGQNSKVRGRVGGIKK